MKIHIEKPEVKLEHPKDMKNGQYSTNIAFLLFEAYKKALEDIDQDNQFKV